MHQLFDLSTLMSFALLMYGHDQELVELPLMHIFGGKFCSTVRAPDQPDAVVFEDWRPRKLDIQVRFPSHSATRPGD